MGAAPVLVLLLVAAAALPRRASAATDAGDATGEERDCFLEIRCLLEIVKGK
ncbi:hypothetical protein Zm00014a_010455 [Zea mays]|uniref:Uncharacterized protein n=1 Tax=Zea mays TaxID=4577 RepID=A0A3L6FCT4_MAIZE|nr:hypothetical protein Zm00014a_010455 [Zea mays]